MNLKPETIKINALLAMEKTNWEQEHECAQGFISACSAPGLVLCWENYKVLCPLHCPSLSPMIYYLFLF